MRVRVFILAFVVVLPAKVPIDLRYEFFMVSYKILASQQVRTSKRMLRTVATARHYYQWQCCCWEHVGATIILISLWLQPTLEVWMPIVYNFLVINRRNCFNESMKIQRTGSTW